MYSGNDDYSPVSDYYGQDQQPKSFRESLKETVENIGEAQEVMQEKQEAQEKKWQKILTNRNNHNYIISNNSWSNVDTRTKRYFNLHNKSA